MCATPSAAAGHASCLPQPFTPTACHLEAGAGTAAVRSATFRATYRGRGGNACWRWGSGLRASTAGQVGEQVPHALGGVSNEMLLLFELSFLSVKFTAPAFLRDISKLWRAGEQHKSHRISTAKREVVTSMTGT